MSSHINFIGTITGDNTSKTNVIPQQYNAMSSNNLLYQNLAVDIFKYGTLPGQNDAGLKILPIQGNNPDSSVILYTSNITGDKTDTTNVIPQQYNAMSNNNLFYQNLAVDIFKYGTLPGENDSGLNIIPILTTGSQLQQRFFTQPNKGVKFHTSFYRDASLAEIRFDASDNISTAVSTKLHGDISNALWSDEDNSGVTIVTVQIISNGDFDKYLGAYTLQFSNWDFSANLPLDNYSALGDSNRTAPIGVNGKNIFKRKDESTDGNSLWDGSTNMMVGIPTNYIQDGTNSKVNFPVSIIDSSNNMNALNHTIDASNEFIDLYFILGKPKLEKIVNAYDQNLNVIDINDLSFEIHNYI